MEEERENRTEGGEGLPDAEFSALMETVSRAAPLVSAIAPLLSGGAPSEKREKGSKCGRREALLLALKPYLSDERCAAVDYLLRLSRVGDAIRSLQ